MNDKVQIKHSVLAEVLVVDFSQCPCRFPKAAAAAVRNSMGNGNGIGIACTCTHAFIT
jgi:hypothetical protein